MRSELHRHARGPWGRAARLLPLVLLLLASALAACRPLYIPLVPEIARPDPRPRVQAELTLREGRPLLSLAVLEVAEEGWLAVQWFGPNNREAASQSVWLDTDAVGLGFDLALPDDVDAVPGEWRALLSMHAAVIRQLSIDVP